MATARLTADGDLAHQRAKKIRSARTMDAMTPSPVHVASGTVVATASEEVANSSAIRDCVLDNGGEDVTSETVQTAALLKGYEISSQSGDDSSIHEVQDAPNLDICDLPDPVLAMEAHVPGQMVSNPKESDRSPAPTVIYLSHIPHGFYEAQMKTYFSQFGAVKHLRLARNRRSGASKHYAFIEFELPEVARIVQQTMNNYLMFKHILKASLLLPSQVHADLWKGAHKRFRRVPWNSIERSRVGGTDREGWAKRSRIEESRRRQKYHRLKDVGYTFDVPGLQDVNALPKPLQDSARPIDAQKSHSPTMTIPQMVPRR